MKYRLSLQETEIIQLTGLATFGLIPWILVLISFLLFPLLVGIVVLVLISCLTFFFSLRIYKVEFDIDFLYLTRRLLKKKIDLYNIVTVKVFPFPVYLFFGQAYIVMVVYTNDNRREKVFTISRKLYSWTPTRDNVFEIKLFRKYINDKKNSLCKL